MQFVPAAKPRRKPNLTPMIDVVFLLLVFFMLASRFGTESILPLPLASAGQEYSGPPRLIDVLPDQELLNGIASADIARDLAPLMQAPTDLVILRGRDGATLQRIVTVTEILRDAGFISVVLVE
ncbi:biopolymer transporter ExbD [Ruegeria sp. ANG10]|uniref:ExbD/TolR family protein n=1 Tax=Ruegeria sp. ANG10 TaxID=3042467 RepID=UPI003454127C